MKPAPFVLHRPATLDEALDALAAAGHEGKVLAGGQSLLPLLSMRLAAPAELVDINAVPGLDRVIAGADGVEVGALVRHAQLEHDPSALPILPLLREALRLVAHPTIRNRGTTLGSICHADPSGEMPAVLALLGGRVRCASTSGHRDIAAADFFLGPLESALIAGELATSVLFARLPAGTGTAIVEVSRRHGDYAVCGVAAIVTAGPDGRVTAARTAYISVGDVPPVLDLTAAVRGTDVSDTDSTAWADAAELAYAQLRPDGDIHATAAYRRHLVRVLTLRALREAARRAPGVDVAA